MNNILAVGIVFDDCLMRRNEAFLSDYYPALISALKGAQHAGIKPFLLTLESMHAARMAAQFLDMMDENTPIIIEYGAGLYHIKHEECDIESEISDYEEQCFERAKFDIIDMIDGHNENDLPYGIVHFNTEHIILASLQDSVTIEQFHSAFKTKLAEHALDFDENTGKGDIYVTVLELMDGQQVLIHVPSANFTNGINSWLNDQDLCISEIALISNDFISPKILEQIALPMTTGEHLLAQECINKLPKGFISTYNGVLGVVDCLKFIANR